MSGDARLHGRAAWSRALAVSAVVLGSIAAGLAVMAFTFGSPANSVVLEVETATLSTLPVVTPTTTPTAPTPAAVPEAAQSPQPPPTTSTTLPPAKVPPTAIAIRDLGISQAVLPVGLQDDGWMEVPDVEDIGWYLHGAVPGRPGATVIVAHVWWDDTPGPFHRLGAIEPGAIIEVGSQDGAVRSYIVVERTMYDKDKLPGNLWRNSGPETLALITCGGDFNTSTRRYEQNIVVYAVPITEATDTEASI